MRDTVRMLKFTVLSTIMVYSSGFLKTENANAFEVAALKSFDLQTQAIVINPVTTNGLINAYGKSNKKAIKKGKKLYAKNCTVCHNDVISADLAGDYSINDIYDSYVNVAEMQILNPLPAKKLKKIIAYLSSK